MKIRKAEEKDINKINELLYQVAEIHYKGCPDIFKEATKKYKDEELLKIINCEKTPVFVAEDEEGVSGYAFCIFQETNDNILLKDKKTLYIDDICVDENKRGKRIGKKLYEYVEEFAVKNNFDNITLNVWSFNKAAENFYEKCQMKPLKTMMEKNLKGDVK